MEIKRYKAKIIMPQTITFLNTMYVLEQREYLRKSETLNIQPFEIFPHSNVSVLIGVLSGCVTSSGFPGPIPFLPLIPSPYPFPLPLPLVLKG